jgi:hypothetical protein
MPTRLLRDTYLSSPSLSRCSPGAQDRFPRYTLAADDFGCFEITPVVVRGKLFPHRSDMTDEAVKAGLAEYEREKMLEVWRTTAGGSASSSVGAVTSACVKPIPPRRRARSSRPTGRRRCRHQSGLSGRWWGWILARRNGPRAEVFWMSSNLPS